MAKEKSSVASVVGAVPGSTTSEETKILPAVGEFDPSRFEHVGDIVLPTLSIAAMVEGDKLYIKALSEIKRVTQIDEETGEIKMKRKRKGSDEQEPSLLPIIIAEDLTTKKRGQLVLGAIVERGLSAAGEITGRLFCLTKGRSLGTGKANLWEVVELRPRPSV